MGLCMGERLKREPCRSLARAHGEGVGAMHVGLASQPVCLAGVGPSCGPAIGCATRLLLWTKSNRNGPKLDPYLGFVLGPDQK